MTDEERAFQDLLARARQGCPDAAADIVRRYESGLRAYVRYRLSRLARGLFDSVDIIQNLWLDLFHKALNRHAFKSSEAFLAFLTRMAEIKRLEAERYAEARKRSASCTRALDADVPVRGPSPVEVVETEEFLEGLRRVVDNPLAIAVRMLQEGSTLDEIAMVMEMPRRPLRRLLAEARAMHLQRHPGATDFPEVPSLLATVA